MLIGPPDQVRRGPECNQQSGSGKMAHRSGTLAERARPGSSGSRLRLRCHGLNQSRLGRIHMGSATSSSSLTLSGAHPMISRTRLSSVSALALVVGLAVPSLASAEPLVGLLATGNQMVKLDSATPATVSAPIAIGNLPAGVTIRAFDFQQSTGVLYGLGSDSRLYSIDTTTGAATPKYAAPFTTLLDAAATGFGMDFNNASNQLRISTNTRQNLRINIAAADAAVTVEDTDFAYAADVPALALRTDITIQLTSLAYTKRSAEGTTTLYGIDSFYNELVKVTATTPPDVHLVSPIPTAAPLVRDTLGPQIRGGAMGFDISPTTDIAYLADKQGNDMNLY
ncbi:MAG: DUF4394 domain-containing protein, partial [Myxococcales bacterium]